MSEVPPDITKLPIDELPEVPLPEVIPLRGDAVLKFIDDYSECLKFLEAWVKFHSEAISAHPSCNTPVANELINSLSKDDLVVFRNDVFIKFKTAHHQRKEMPIGFKDDFRMEIDEEGNADEAMLLDPSRKKKASLLDRVVEWPKRLFKRKREKTVEEESESISEAAKSTEEEDEQQLARERRDSYEELKVRFGEFLQQQVDEFRKKKQKRTELASPEGEDALWIDNMAKRLQVCHLAVKVLDIVKGFCKEAYTVLSFDPLGTGLSGTFVGDNALTLQNRIAYLATMKVLTFILVEDTEKVQCSSKTYDECLEIYLSKKGLCGKLPLTSSPEKVILRQMADKKSVLTDIENSPQKIQRNLEKPEAERELLLDTDGDNVDLAVVYPVRSETVSPGPSGEELQQQETATGDPKIPSGATSGNPSTGDCGQQGVSPMELSPAPEKTPSDEDSSDIQSESKEEITKKRRMF